jgi:hypothetical protein
LELNGTVLYSVVIEIVKRLFFISVHLITGISDLYGSDVYTYI